MKNNNQLKIKSMKNLILLLFVAGSIVSCGPSTKIVKSWMEPGASITQGPANKTLVIAVVKDETSRRIIEDQLVKRLKGVGIASYNVLTPDLLKEANETSLKPKLTEGKYTHVLVMRLGDIEKETTYNPGTTTVYYGGYGRYYGHSAALYSTPGYYSTDKNYFVETTVYSVNPDKLIWNGTTKTVNPSKIEKTVNEIADVVSDKMKKEGFLK
jgi:hypothetical protein